MFKNRILSVLLIALMLFGTLPIGIDALADGFGQSKSEYGDGSVDVCVDGNKIDSGAFYENGKLYVSSEIYKSFGLQCNFVKELGMYYIKCNTRFVAFSVYSDKYYINKHECTFAKPVFKNGALYLPFDLLSYLVGATSEYNTAENVVYLLQNKKDDLNSMECGENIVQGGDFESDFTKDIYWFDRANSCKLEWEKEIVKTGEGSCHVSGRTSPWNSVAQDLKSSLLESGSGAYAVSGWIRTADSLYNMTVKLLAKSGDDIVSESAFNVLANNADWTYFSQIISVTVDESVTSAVLYIETDNTKDASADIQDFYVDDIEFRKVYEGFEDGSTYIDPNELTYAENKYLTQMSAQLVDSSYFYPQDMEVSVAIKGKATDLKANFFNKQLYVTDDVLNNYGIAYSNYENGGAMYIAYNGKFVSFSENSDVYYINGERHELYSPKVINQKLYIPFELVGILENISFEYDKESKTVNFVKRVSESQGGADVLGPELIQLGDFEDDIVNYSVWTDRAVSAKIEWNRDCVHSGIGSGYITGRTSPWNSIGQKINSVLISTGSGKYHVSGWIRTADSPYEMYVRLYAKETEKTLTDITIPVQATNTEWTFFEKDIDITTSSDLKDSVLYFESKHTDDHKADIQSFYIDDISLKKYGGDTAEDEDDVDDSAEKAKAEQNAKFAESLSSQKSITVYPRGTDAFVRNPYKGFVNYGIYSDEDLTKESVGISTIINCRSNWAFMDPKEGEYNWKYIDDRIELAKKFGGQVTIGIEAATNNKGTLTTGNVVSQSTPLWVFDAGCKYVVTEGWGQTALVPVWDDPVYMEKMGNFVNALLERYDDNPYVAAFDMRTYGNWGEWHVASLEPSQPIDFEAMKKHIEMWKNATKPLNMFVANAAALQYAMETVGAGVRKDGALDASDNNVAPIKVVIGKSQSVLEWLEPGYLMYQPGGRFYDSVDLLPILFEQYFVYGKASQMALGNTRPDEFYADYSRVCDYWANRIGYWFRPVEFEFPENINSGVFRVKMKNDGVAPIYAGKINTLNVQLALLDANNKVLKKLSLGNIDMFDWKPEEYTESFDEYDFGDVPGAAKLAFGLFTSDTVENPNIKLGIECETVDGWYVISSLSTTESAYASDDAIYRASKLSATSGYGYHHADMVADNDKSTYWELKYAKDGWLEVDFGKAKEVSEVTISSDKRCNVKYVIQGYSDGVWTDIAKRSSLNVEAQNITFPRKAYSRIRVYVPELGSETFSINELKIK